MKKAFAFVALALALQGCTTTLIEGQKQELEVYRQKGLEVREKSPGLAAALGVLPIGGYAYTGHPFLAVSTIPLYPFLGPLWMPYDAYQSAQARNYYATKHTVERARAKAYRDNDVELDEGRIDERTHRRIQREIEEKYAAY